MQQREPIPTVRLVEVRGREDDDGALGTQSVEDLPEFAPRDRVDAGGRLIEQHDLRGVHQRAGQAELLLHPSGELTGSSDSQLPRQVAEIT
jgi:hypothetical protein